MVENIINRYIAYSVSDKLWNSTRDRMMYENFVKIFEKYHKGKYYGQWGLNHAFQGRQGGVDWFAALLDQEQDSPLKGKILSIVYLYQDCKAITNGKYKVYSCNSYQLRPGIRPHLVRET